MDVSGERGVCVREREGRYDQFLYVCLRGYVCTYVMWLQAVKYCVCICVCEGGVLCVCTHNLREVWSV